MPYFSRDLWLFSAFRRTSAFALILSFFRLASPNLERAQSVSTISPPTPLLSDEPCRSFATAVGEEIFFTSVFFHPGLWSDESMAETLSGRTRMTFFAPSDFFSFYAVVFSVVPELAPAAPLPFISPFFVGNRYRDHQFPSKSAVYFPFRTASFFLAWRPGGCLVVLQLRLVNSYDSPLTGFPIIPVDFDEALLKSSPVFPSPGILRLGGFLSDFSPRLLNF